MPLFTFRSPERTNILQWVKGGDRKPNQTKTDCGRAEETLKIVTVKVILPSATTSYHISVSQSQDSEGLRREHPQWVVCFRVRQAAKQSVVFILHWLRSTRPTKQGALRETVSKTDGFALNWMSCAWRLIWHLAEVPQLTKHVTQPARTKTVNVQKLSTDGHVGCSSSKDSLLLKIHLESHSHRVHIEP